MIRPIKILIGLGALVATSTYAAVAAPVPQDANGGIRHRAGNSLSNLENRSVAKDFDEFFLETSQTTRAIYPEGTIGTRSQNQSGAPLLENIRFELGDDSPNSNVDIFPNARNGDRSGNSQILYEFEEW